MPLASFFGGKEEKNKARTSPVVELAQSDRGQFKRVTSARRSPHTREENAVLQARGVLLTPQIESGRYPRQDYYSFTDNS